jgi:hypothetical protein
MNDPLFAAEGAFTTLAHPPAARAAVRGAPGRGHRRMVERRAGRTDASEVLREAIDLWIRRRK